MGLLVFALLPASAAWAQDDTCPFGAVNTITGNYTNVSATDPWTGTLEGSASSPTVRNGRGTLPDGTASLAGRPTNSLAGHGVKSPIPIEPVETDPYEEEKCEICVAVRVQTGDDRWEEVAQVCGLWSDAQAHDLMFRIGRCGLIVPAFEEVGNYYGPNVPIRADAVWTSRCPNTK